MDQWVKDLVLSLLWHGLISVLGTSACHGCVAKKKKKKKTQQKIHSFGLVGELTFGMGPIVRGGEFLGAFEITPPPSPFDPASFSYKDTPLSVAHLFSTYVIPRTTHTTLNI